MVCLLGVCIPDSLLWPLLLLLLRPLLDLLGLNPQTSSPSSVSTSSQCLSDDMDWDSFVRSEHPTIVRFTAKWCLPCQAIAPVFEELKQQYSARLPQARILTVDVDSMSRLAATCGVVSLPALHAYRSGRLVHSCRPSSEDQVRGFFETALQQ